MTTGNRHIREFHQRILQLNGGTWFDFEPCLAAFYGAILRPGSTAIDGGANIALHTLQMAQAVLPDGLVVAIEPVPDFLQQISTRLQAFQIPDHLVRRVPYGLSSAPGEADFFQVTHPMQHGMSGLRNRYYLQNHQVKQIRVGLTTLDTVCRDLDRIDFIKLDLEGAELDALRGGRRTLERFRPAVAIEQDQNSPASFGYSWDDLLEYFDSLQYEIYDLFGLRYSEAAMFEGCAVWDFVGLPAEYPNKQRLFGEVRRQMDLAGVILDAGTPAGQPLAARSPNLSLSDLTSACVLDYIGPVANPWTLPSIHVAGDTRPLRFSGWAVDEPLQAVAGGVDVVIDEVPYGSWYGGYRSDIAEHFKNVSYHGSGFLLLLPPGTLQKGEHVVTLRTISNDGKCYYQGPTLAFIVD